MVFSDFTFGYSDRLKSQYLVPYMFIPQEALEDNVGLVDETVYYHPRGGYRAETRKRIRDLAYGKLNSQGEKGQKHGDTLRDFVRGVNQYLMGTGAPETVDPEDFQEYLDENWMNKWDFLDMVHNMSYDVCGHIDFGDQVPTCAPSYPDFVEDVLLEPLLGKGDYIFNHPKYIEYRNFIMDQEPQTEAPDSDKIGGIGTKKAVIWIVVLIVVLLLVAVVLYATEKPQDA